MSEPQQASGSAPPERVARDPAEARTRTARLRPIPGAAPGHSAPGDCPDAHAERVEALRAQIASGSYAPDPKEIARSILESGL
jgi:hypothetical protein